MIAVEKSKVISAAPHRKAGYLEYVRRYSVETEAHFEIPDEVFTKLLTDYALPRGLGDMLAKVAQPIAGMIDAVAGTDLKNCGGCKKRRDALNKRVPLT